MATVKRLRSEETTTTTVVDRLSDIPESLQLRLLSSLDARHAVGTMMLSKSWLSSWTCIPALNFSSNAFQHLDAFDNFVANALSHRQPVKLDRLTFKRDGTCCADILQKVFDYAFSHGVQELDAYVVPTMGHHEAWRWPISSSPSLTSLKLQSKYDVGCSFLEPRSAASFKNLTTLHLERVIITDLDPFSGFPALDKLKLVYCYIRTGGDKALSVHAAQLSEFTFLNCHHQNVNLTTPKLRYFEWAGSVFPRLKTHLPVLDTAVISYDGFCRTNQANILSDNLLMLFDTLYRAKSLTLSAPVVHLLTLFLVVNGCSPFRALKCLKLDFSSDLLYPGIIFSLSETLKLVPGVKAYLLLKSPDARCTIINHPNAESPCSISHKGTCERQAVTRPKRMVRKPARFLD